ncbi:YheV family putative zinc ribbon protein [Marinicellulosiphila megalodicopiae]|uniref:YheV family putative zinc ribbon protein n=1 Tax=Marinicellulosiphila megalodicopiae TaxID=2724896 RepID=UPI003BAEE288
MPLNKFKPYPELTSLESSNPPSKTLSFTYPKEAGIIAPFPFNVIIVIKRFIAGAVCPKCGAQDCIRAYQDVEKALYHRDCVDCGFEDALSTAVNQPNELSTRVSASTNLDDVVSEPIRFDPNSIT